MTLPDYFSKSEQKYLLNTSAISHRVLVSQGSKRRAPLKYSSSTDNLLLIILRSIYMEGAFLPVFCAITHNVGLSIIYNHLK